MHSWHLLPLLALSHWATSAAQTCSVGCPVPTQFFSTNCGQWPTEDAPSGCTVCPPNAGPVYIAGNAQLCACVAGWKPRLGVETLRGVQDYCGCAGQPTAVACVRCQSGEYCPGGYDLTYCSNNPSLCAAGHRIGHAYSDLTPSVAWAGHKVGPVGATTDGQGEQCVATVGNRAAVLSTYSSRVGETILRNVYTTQCDPSKCGDHASTPNHYYSNTVCTGKAWQVCTACPAGTVSIKVGGSFGGANYRHLCACPAGQYSFLMSDTCTAGLYTPGQSNPISTGCNTCPGGYYCPGGVTGSTPPYTLSPRILCNDCGPGFYPAVYCSQTANTVCAACPPNTYKIFSYDQQCTQCLVCPAGQYVTQACTPSSNTVCSPCPVGTYKGSPGSGACLACPAGTWNNLAGQSACATCTPGTVSAPRTDCTCPMGTYKSSSQPNWSCVPCPAGTYYPVSPATISCVQCFAGYFTSTTGQTECRRCGAGVVSGDRRACTCSPGGYMTNDAAQPFCGVCPAGMFCTGGTSAPQACQQNGPGSIWSVEGSASCQTCPPGSYTSGANPSTTCTPCPRGYRCDGGPTKTPCKAGERQPDPGRSTCVSCSLPSEWSPEQQTGIQDCSVCPPGSSVLVTAGKRSRCVPCPAGSRCPDGESVAPCNNGDYQPDAGRESCSFCASVGNGYSPPGGVGALACLTCAPGSYIPNRAHSACQPCPAGFACNGTEARFACFSGRYSPVTGLSACVDCPEGSVSPTFSGIPVGQTACTQCLPGTVAADTGTYCAECVDRTSCPDGVAVLPCNSGAASEPLKQECVSCQPGTYTPDMPTPVLPTSVLYVADAGFGECLACPTSGFYSDEGAAVCRECEPGYVCVSGLRTACRAGTYSPSGGSTACEDCPPGTYTPASDTQGFTGCLACPTGSSLNVLGTGCDAMSPFYTCRDEDVGTLVSAGLLASHDHCTVVDPPSRAYASVLGGSQLQGGPFSSGMWRGGFAWAPASVGPTHYMQIPMPGGARDVVGLVVRGRVGRRQWCTSINVFTSSNNAQSFERVTADPLGCNTDDSSQGALVPFPRLYPGTTHVRVTPVSWNADGTWPHLKAGVVTAGAPGG